MQKLLLALILLVAASVASAADSPKDVQALIAQGNYPAAEAALRQAVSEHPQSAKAHYVLAEVLAHEGNIGEAKAEADKAAALDPATRFTDPAKFKAFQQKVNQALAPAPLSRSSSTPLHSVDAPAVGGGERERSGGLGFGSILLIVVVIGGIAFIWSRRRSAQNNAFPGYGSVPPPAPGATYGGPSGYPGYAPPPSSGIGSTIAAGVGGLAAGALLDEVLRGHNNESNRDSNSNLLNGNGGGDTQRDPSGDAYNDLRDDPIDMGNNDSSWDDSSSSSDDSGSSDDNSW